MSRHIPETIGRVLRAARQRLLYPDGHPTRLAAAEEARTALRELLAEMEQVDLVITEDSVSLVDEEPFESDSALEDLARFLHDQNICGLGLRQDITDPEIDVLLDLMQPQAAPARPSDLAARLHEAGATHLIVTTIDHGRIVPRSRAGGPWWDVPHGLDGAAILRRLVAQTLRSQQTWASSDEKKALLALLDDPVAAAEAIFSTAALDVADGLPVWQSTSAPPAVGLDGYVPLTIDGPLSERPDVGAAAIAAGFLKLGEAAATLSPEEQREVHVKLANALRQFAPEQQAYILGTEGSTEAGDALTEAARHLSVEEIVGIFRASARELFTEKSTTLHRLVERVGSTPERLRELAPALKQALLGEGMTESTFDSTLGVVVNNLMAENEVGPETVLTSGFSRPEESVRTSRRALLQERLDARTRQLDEVTVYLEMLELSQTPGHLGKIARALDQGVAALPEEQQMDPLAQAISALSEKADGGESVPEAVRAEAQTVLSELLSTRGPEWLASVLSQSGGGDRSGLVAVLARAGAAGRAVLLDRLRAGASSTSDSELSLIVHELVEAEDAQPALSGPGAGARTGTGTDRLVDLADLILDHSFKRAGVTIEALVQQAGPSAARYLLELLRRGDFGVRNAVIEAIPCAQGPLFRVAMAALRDPEVDVACGAARALGRSGNSDAAPALVEHLRMHHWFDRRLHLSTAVALALGELRHGGAVLQLADVLHRPGWWPSARNDACRLAAGQALGMIGTTAALRALANRAQGERCREIRDLARAASERLRELQAGQASAEGGLAHAH